MKIRAIMLSILIACFFMTLNSCEKEAPLDEKVVLDNKEAHSEEIKEEPVLTDEEKYEIKLKNYEKVSALSASERAEDFLTALTEGNLEKLDVYLYSKGLEELLKADIKAEIVEEAQIVDVKQPRFENIGYQAEVRLTVENSETEAFENGVHSYLLLMADFEDVGFVKFFAPRDKLNLYLKANEPKDRESIVYKADSIASGLMIFVSPELTEEVMSEASPMFLGHFLVHSGAVQSEFITKKEFKDVASKTLGIDDEQRLEDISGWLDFKYKEENGVYDVYCGHDIHSVAKALEKVEENEDGCVLTYALYTDFSYIVKVATLTASFTKNADGSIGIENLEFEKLLDYPVNTYSP